MMYLTFKVINFSQEGEDTSFSFNFSFNNGFVDFTIEEPNRVSAQRWDDFYQAIKNNTEKILAFDRYSLYHNNEEVQLYSIIREGQDDEDEITYNIPSHYCLEAFKQAKNCQYLS